MSYPGQWLGRSFVVGYGAGAGHSAWRATKSHAPVIVIAGIAALAAVAPLYFVYKTTQAIFERAADMGSRLLMFGGGLAVTVMYLGWVLYWSTFVFSSVIHPAKLPGYDLVPKQAVTAVYQNTVFSMGRSVLLFAKVLGSTSDTDFEFEPIEPGEDNGDMLATMNLVARLYFVAAVLGALSGIRERQRSVAAIGRR